MTRHSAVSAPVYPRPLLDRPWLPQANAVRASVARDEGSGISPKIPLAEFVRVKFLPEHVEKKSVAGRRHYQAMLKHILQPETVDQLFHASVVQPKSRLKAVPGWPYLDKVKLCELRAQHVRDLTEAAHANGYSAQTVKHIRNAIGVMIGHAKREGLFADENPASGVDLPSICRERPQDLTIAKAREMLRMMQYPEREIALIAITTGMSIQEICGLQWKHVNLTKSVVDCDGESVPSGFILLRQHWYPEGIVDLHSNRIRLIEVPQPLSLTLLRLKQEAMSADPDSFVLVTPSGAPVRPTNFCKVRLKAIGRKISMPWLSWQLVRRAHDALLSELRNQLSTDLVSSAW